MQLDELWLSHFKRFKKVELACSKLTLLTGPNSSGKSSIIHGLLGAVQTTNFPYFFSPNGSYVTMGDFQELAYRHSPKTTFGLGLRISEENSSSSVRVFYRNDQKTGLPKLTSLDYQSKNFDLQIRSPAKEYNANWNYRKPSDHGTQMVLQKAVRDLVRGLAAVPGLKKRRTAPKLTDLEAIFNTTPSGHFKVINLMRLNEVAGGKLFLSSELGSLATLMQRFGQNFNHISSFRVPPERTYYQRTKAALKVDKFGENSIDQLIEWERSQSSKMAELQLALKQLGLAEELGTQQYSGGRFDVRVVPTRSRLPSSLCDVGFGVSQCLPVLVADLQLDTQSTLAVSQPEIHLHPSVQAALADYFSRQARRFKKRYILETHSEYLLNRFRLLIAKGELKEEDLAVYYLGEKRSEPHCFRLWFRKDGTIEGAPKDFFSTYMMDVMSIAMNATPRG